MVQVRKIIKKRVMVLTPFPISICKEGEDVRGDILKYIFPSNGVIEKGVIYFPIKPKKDVTVEASLMGMKIGGSYSFVIGDRFGQTDIKMNNNIGDRLTVSLSSEEPVKEVWMALLWTPSITEARKITEIDKVEE